MKQSLIFLLFFLPTYVFAQMELNTRVDHRKEMVKAIDNKYQYFSSEINEGDLKLTGFYHFDIAKVIEETGGKTRKYYYWADKLFSVFDSRMNKQLFFKGDYKNASEKLYTFYNTKAEEYLTKFESHFVKTNVNLFYNDRFYPHRYRQYYSARTTREELQHIDCIIKEDDRFEVRRMEVYYAKSGLDVWQKYTDCIISEKIKQVALERYQLSFSIFLLDKKNHYGINLPEIDF